MKLPSQRTVFRWIHLIVSIPILGYIYSPFDKLPQYAAPTRFVFFPIMVLTGLWMWKGQVVRRLFSKETAQPGAND
jgi:thiosulfate reductase cytochrome b subunit